MKLYNFQEKILEQTKDYNRVLYALEMGLGKTFIGAEKAHSLLKDTKCILVVCQKSKVEDWFNHFADNYTDCAIYDLTQKADSIDRWFLDMTGAPTTNYVGIINYELIFRREKLLGINNRSFTLLLDESSMIQNATRKRSRFILKLKPKNVILLSGTVVNGSYEKLWSQCTLLG